MNADGNEQEYSAPKNRGTRPTDTEVPRNEGDGRPGRHSRTEREKERQKNMKCYNCTERGHSAAKCTKPQVPIPKNWSKEEKEFAQKWRDQDRRKKQRRIDEEEDDTKDPKKED